MNTELIAKSLDGGPDFRVDKINLFNGKNPIKRNGLEMIISCGEKTEVVIYLNEELSSEDFASISDLEASTVLNARDARLRPVQVV